MVLLLGVDDQPDRTPCARGQVPSMQPAWRRPQPARSSPLRIRVELPVRSGDTQHFRGTHRDAETRWDLEHVPARVLAVGHIPTVRYPFSAIDTSIRQQRLSESPPQASDDQSEDLPAEGPRGDAMNSLPLVSEGRVQLST